MAENVALPMVDSKYTDPVSATIDSYIIYAVLKALQVYHTMHRREYSRCPRGPRSRAVTDVTTPFAEPEMHQTFCSEERASRRDGDETKGREAMALVGARLDYQMRRVLAQPCAMRIIRYDGDRTTLGSLLAWNGMAHATWQSPSRTM